MDGCGVCMGVLHVIRCLEHLLPSSSLCPCSPSGPPIPFNHADHFARGPPLSLLPRGRDGRESVLVVISGGHLRVEEVNQLGTDRG